MLGNTVAGKLDAKKDEEEYEEAGNDEEIYDATARHLEVGPSYLSFELGPTITTRT